MKSVIRYFGGKGNIYGNIIEHFPFRTEYNTYIEPFGGAYSVGFQKPRVPVEIYNDLEKNVYTLFKVISDKSMYEQFKEKCDLVFYMQDLREEYKKLLKTELSMVDRAFYFFYVNRTSMNGNGGMSVNPTVRREMSKSVSDMLSAIDSLPEVHNFLSQIIILNTDGVDLIKKYNTPNVLLYCDPPYEHSTRTVTRYAVDMDIDKQKEFLSAVLESKAKIIISGYDCELYSVLDEKFTKVSFEKNTVNTNNSPKTVNEFLWVNY